MSPASLYLSPADPHALPAMPDVLATLARLEITAQPLAEQPATFTAGDGFARHVVYAGCSPHLLMQPPADGSLAFCHVALHGPFAHPVLVTGANTVKPRCPDCRARFDDWRERLPHWQAGSEAAVCPDCGATREAVALDWRGHAAAGRVLVELRNVFPGEATPSDLLIQQLQAATGMAWRHAWAGGWVNA